MLAIVAIILSDRYCLVILYPRIHQNIVLKIMTTKGKETNEYSRM